MKKNIFFVAVAVIALSMVSCKKENIAPINPNTNGGEVNATARVKSTSDLHNTDWTCSMTFNQILFMLGADTTCIPDFGGETYDLGLNFDGTLAHFSFPENIEAYDLNANDTAMTQIFGLAYQYSYDGTTHTGYLLATTEDEDGNDVPAHLQFVYNDTTDVITFNVDLYYAGETPDDVDTNTITFPLIFVRNE
jgi:hypothetical protein